MFPHVFSLLTCLSRSHLVFYEDGVVTKSSYASLTLYLVDILLLPFLAEDASHMPIYFSQQITRAILLLLMMIRPKENLFSLSLQCSMFRCILKQAIDLSFLLINSKQSMSFILSYHIDLFCSQQTYQTEDRIYISILLVRAYFCARTFATLRMSEHIQV